MTPCDSFNPYYTANSRTSCNCYRVTIWALILGGVLLPLMVAGCIAYIFTYRVHECKLTPWSDWDECKGPCHHGKQSRTRAVLAQHLCYVLPAQLKLQETRKCSKNCRETMIAKLYNMSMQGIPSDAQTSTFQKLENSTARTFHKSPSVIDCNFYVSDWRAKRILYMNSAGHSEVLIETSGRSDGLAYDHKLRKLFWTEVSPDALMYTVFDNSGDVLQLLHLPNHADAVALDTKRQLVFVGVKETGILMVSYDGRNEQYLATKVVYWCEGLAVDHKFKILYFSDVRLSQIFSLSYHDVQPGRQPTLLVREPGDGPMGLYLDTTEQRLYWILGHYGEIKSTDLRAGGVRRDYLPMGGEDRMAWSMTKCKEQILFTSFIQQAVFQVINKTHAERFSKSGIELSGPVGLVAS